MTNYAVLNGPFRMIPLCFIFPRKIPAKMPFRIEGKADLFNLEVIL